MHVFYVKLNLRSRLKALKFLCVDMKGNLFDVSIYACVLLLRFEFKFVVIVRENLIFLTNLPYLGEQAYGPTSRVIQTSAGAVSCVLWK